MNASRAQTAQWKDSDRCDKLGGLLSDMVTNHRPRLAELLRTKSLVRGEIVLSSGQKSNYYLDCKLTTLHPEGALLTGYAVLELIDEMKVNPHAIGGMSMGADPIVSATVVVSEIEKRPLPGFLIRKERKGHGRHKQLEGIDGAIGQVVIVDEVCTTGASTQEAIDAAEREGCEVVAVISLVDREEGGSEKLRAKYNYRSIFTARELLAEEELATVSKTAVSHSSH
jgi:orotate phosphoribosyltransferase